MKYQADIKSIIIGFLGATLLFATFSFKDESPEKGRYQTAVGDKGVVILDTQTGAYIMNIDATNIGWRKGDFPYTHNTVKPTKEKYLSN